MNTKTKSSLPIWILDIPFEWRMSASSLGVRWDPSLREMVYKGETLPPHLQPFKAQALSLPWHRQYHVNGRHLEKIKRVQPFYTPQDHQEEASVLIQKAYKKKAPGFVLADEVGVGKTMGAWSFALREESLKTVLIVTTASAQAHWRQTILHAGWLPTHSVMIINYDRLGKLFEEPEDGLSSTRRKGKRKRLAKQGKAPQFDLVIFDESHKGKNPESARGLMMRKIAQQAKFCIYASATAGQNPIELVYLAPLLSFITKSKIASTTIADFTEWCIKQGLNIKKGAYGKIVWEQNEDDLELIHSWLFNSNPKLALRRLPQDIQNWPEMERQLLPLDLSPLARQSYAKMWEEFVKEDMKNQQQSSTPQSKSKQSLKHENNRLRLRQESSWLRMDATVALAQEYMEQGKKVAISCAFVPVLHELVKKLEDKGIQTSLIFGGQNAQEKEQQRLDFQKGSSNAIVFTVEEAISLHQGEYIDPKKDKQRVLIIHDIRWSAIQMAQIEGRTHRNGQFAPIIWTGASDTVDMDIAEVMINKVKNMKALHGDPLSDLQKIEEVLRSHVQKSNSLL